MIMPYIKQGFGFNVEQDFARAWADLPLREVTPADHPQYVHGVIDGNPASQLSFLRRPIVRVYVKKSCIAD
jgi:hypothetical protein